jgi:mitochondrial fission protein ELM1
VTPPEPVWVLDDPRAGTSSQALGIAERLDVPFRRIPVSWNWMAHVAALSRRGSLIGLSLPREPGDASQLWTASTALVASRMPTPKLVISAGSRSAAVALWLKSRFGSAIVHCMRPGLGGVFRAGAYDLLVIPEHDHPRRSPNVLATIGPPHRLSPDVLRQAGERWEERLDHLPHPRIALLVGGGRDSALRGPDMVPALAHTLGEQVARLAIERGGCVLATSSRRTGEEATAALAAGMRRCLHIIYRWGEPGENPYRGFLATADAIVVTADSASMLCEACATGVPVFVALPELAGARQRRLIAMLTDAGQVRPLSAGFSTWTRTPLDETGRVAREIERRFRLD